MRNMWKRSLSLFLAIVMVMGMIPMSVFAEEGDVCVHENVETRTQDATCTEQGLWQAVCLDCGDVVSEESLDAAGHSWDGNTCTVCGESQPVEEEPAEDPVQEEPPVQQEPVVEEPPVQQEPVRQEPVMTFSAARAALKTETGIAWIDTTGLEPPEGMTEEEELYFMAGIVSSGKIRNAVLRALGRYSSATAKEYTVRYDGLDVANSFAFLANQDKAEELRQVITDAVGKSEPISFEVQYGEEQFIAEIIFKNALDITLSTETIGAKTKPSDLYDQVEAAADRIKIDGFSQAEIRGVDSFVSLERLYPNDDPVFPGRGEKNTTYGPLWEVVIEEALEGQEYGSVGGYVELKNTTEQYVIKFEPGNGSNMDPIPVWEGETFTMPENPTREGWNFMGWDGISAKPGEKVKPNQSVTYKAKWEEIKTYTVTYYVDKIDGELWGEPFENVTEGSKTPAPTTNPESYAGEKDGKQGTYYCIGWVDAKGNSPAATVTKDAEYVASWVFVEDAGSGEDDQPSEPPKTVFNVTYFEYDFSTKTWEPWTGETVTRSNEYGLVDEPEELSTSGLISYGWHEISKEEAESNGFLVNGKIKDEYCKKSTFNFDQPVDHDVYLVKGAKLDLNGNGKPDGENNDFFAMYHFYYYQEDGEYAEKDAYKTVTAGNVTDYGEAFGAGYDYSKNMGAVAGKHFTGWEKDDTKTVDKGEDGYFIYVLTPQFVTDQNGNGVEDSCETVEFMIYVPGEDEDLTYAEYAAAGSQYGTITFDGEAPVAAAEGSSQYLIDTTGTDIKVTASGNAYPVEITVERAMGDKVEFSPRRQSNAALIGTLKDTEAADKNADANVGYIITITFGELALKDSASLEVTGGSYTQKDVFDAVMKSQAAEGDTLKVQYVARETDAVTVDVEPLFQWFKDNYTAYFADLLENVVKSPIYTDGNGRHKIDITYNDVILPVDATPATAWKDEGFDANSKWPIKTPQDVANEYVSDFLTRFDQSMRTDGDFDLANELLALGINISDGVKKFADVRPFGYDPDGSAAFSEKISIDYKSAATNKTFKTKVGTVENYVTVSMVDKRAETVISAKDISVNYGAKISAPAGLELAVDFNGETANDYQNISVISRGSAANRPARTTVDLYVNKTEADLDIPKVFYKEHTETEKNPVIDTKGVEVVQIIAGLDMTSLDVDLDAVLSNPMDSTAAVKNADPVVWVKLPKSLVNLKNVMRDVLNELKKAGELPAIDGMNVIEQVLNMELNDRTKEYTWDDVASLFNILKSDNQDINKIKEFIQNQATVETIGDLRVYFSSDEYPQDPGAYVNIGIAMDNNYVNGLTSILEAADIKDKIRIGKEYGIVLISPVLTRPNHGIQLKHEAYGVQNVYEMDVEDAKKGLKVYYGDKDVTDASEVYYYGFNNDLAVHYESESNSKTPTKPGIYFVSAIYRSEDYEVLGTDMAVLIVGMEKASVEVKRTVKTYTDGTPYAAEIIVKNEKNEELYYSGKAGMTIISGTVTKSENTSLRDLKAEVNVDFPAALDLAMSAAYEYVTGKKPAGEDITKATLTQSDLLKALNWLVDQIEAKKLDAKLADWHVPGTLLEMLDTPEKYAIRTLEGLIAEIESIDLERNAEITFENRKTYSEYGVYLYFAMITDPVYITDLDANVLIIKAADEDFIMEDQTKVYNGKGQLPDIEDETGRDYFMIIYDEQQKSISFLLDNDMEAMRKKLEEHGVIEGKTIGQVFDAADAELADLAQWIMEGIEAQGKEIIDKLHIDKASAAYERAMSKLNARLNSYRETMTGEIQDCLLSLSKVVDRDTKLSFSAKPTDVGRYKVHAYSYAIAHEEATLTIVPEVTITAVVEKENISVGEKPEFTYSDSINPADEEKPALDVKYNVYATEENENGELVKIGAPIPEENWSALAVGTYIVEPYQENEPAGYGYVYVSAVFTVEAEIGTISGGIWSMSLDSVIYLNFYPEFNGFSEDFDFANNGGVVIWTGDTTPTGDMLYVGAPNCTVIMGMDKGNNGEWRVRTHEIFAKNIGDMVIIRPFVKVAEDKYIYREKATGYSPARFCYDALSGNSHTEDEKNVCAALLEYGASAQNYFDYNTDSLVTNIPNTYPEWTTIDLSEYDIEYDASYLDAVNSDSARLTALSATFEGTRDNYVFYRVNQALDLRGAICMSVGYNIDGIDVDKDVAKAEVLFWTDEDLANLNSIDYDLQNYTSLCELTKATETQVDIGDFRAKSQHILAKHLGETLYFVGRLELNDGTVYRTGLTVYSPDAFVRDYVDNGVADREDEICKRIAVYGEMAKRCFIK